MDPRASSDPTLSHLTKVASSRPSAGSNPTSVRVVSGEGEGPYVLPSLYSFDDPHRFGRVRGRVQWRLLLAIVSVAGAATAGTVGGVWATRAHAIDASSDVVLSDTPVATTPFESVPAVAVHRVAASSRPVRGTHASTSTAIHAAIAAPASTQDATESHLSCTQQCGMDVQCILRCPYQGTEGGHSALLAEPSRDQVVSAMQQVRGAVVLCGDPLTQGPRTTQVTVTFAPNGQANDAEVSAPYGGSTPGDCIERAVRRAHVPRFTGGEFTVTYPFNVR